jgi:hypothetical protein
MSDETITLTLSAGSLDRVAYAIRGTIPAKSGKEWLEREIERLESDLKVLKRALEQC